MPISLARVAQIKIGSFMERGGLYRHMEGLGEVAGWLEFS